ncbi:MAG: argininosuccinate lyase [Robiginitalea sp.]|jgi:argininosuccinate lyase
MKLWDKGSTPDKQMDLFTVGNDRELDQILVEYDLKASRAHAEMLGKIGILDPGETRAIVTELDKMMEEARAGDFAIEQPFEDMHSKIEYELTARIGEAGKKIHTARSRNDQILTALQLYLKDTILSFRTQVKELFEVLLMLAETHKEVLLPGYTHLQVAMPSSFGLWFSAYAESLVDDTYFLQTAFRVADQNPLGSAAGYGSSFPVDRHFTTSRMGFATQKFNVVAAQMGRGKVERATAMAMASIAGTLGKMAMDICLYLSQNFAFISFPEELTTGSSIMPHKKNPDLFELVRAKCNLVQGLPNQLTLLTTNLTSGYHRDLQLTKALLLPAVEQLKACLEITTSSLGKIKVNTSILEDPKYDYLFSVDSLDAMVQEGIPFREAYRKIADMIASGVFKPDKSVRHTHQGSLGNLCLEEIRNKMEQAWN